MTSKARGSSRFKLDFWTAVTVVVFALFLFFLIWPMARLLLNGFRDASTGAFSLENFKTFFGKKYYTNAIWNSLSVAVCVTAAAVIIGTLLAYLLTTFEIKGKGFIQILIILSMMSPSFIGAYSWIILLGRSGVVTMAMSNWLGVTIPSIYGFGGIVLVLVMKFYSMIYLYVSGAMKKIDVSLIEASQSLGCKPSANLIKMYVPLVLPTLLSAALMVFMTSISDFGTAMLIGEGYRVLPVLIYREYMGELGGNAYFASSIAIVMMCLTTGLYLLQRYVINRKSFRMRGLKTIKAKPITGVGSVFANIFIYGVVLLSIVPQATVIYTSFLKTNGTMFTTQFSLDSYRATWRTSLSSLKNSFVYGLVAIALIVMLGIFTAYLSVRRRNVVTSLLDVTTMLPYIISGSILGIMLLLTFNKSPFFWGGTAIIMIIAFVIRRLPHTLRSSVGILYQISPSTEEAAISLGAHTAKAFFGVTVALMLPGVLTGAILSWVTVINELSASIILYTSSTRTLSVAVYAEVAKANYGQAAALATVLMAATIISLLVFLKASGKKDISL